VFWGLVNISSRDGSQYKNKTEFDELKKPINDIIALAIKLDERYREKCFEIVLEFYLRSKFEASARGRVQPLLLKKTQSVCLLHSCGFHLTWSIRNDVPAYGPPNIPGLENPRTIRPLHKSKAFLNSHNNQYTG